ncbi:hypothetical protein [Phytopseudomonas dryadis]|uniref:hypothetical protein n=1 Tax=Pseudomonadaceae TaxID=135621 RepID=UPI0013F16687|nr:MULTISPECIES: hypothetical protein [Pseudomonas]
MDIRILTLTEPQGQRWQVVVDKHKISFRSEEEARQFVATLEARLRAPHVLPDWQRLAG